MTFKPDLLLKTLTCGLALSALIITTGCSDAATSESKTATSTSVSNTLTVKHVDATGAHALLLAQPQTIVLDVRTPREIEAGYIEGAVFADFSEDDFNAQLTELDRHAPYIVHCKGGGRSTKALTTLKELGFTNITHMDGGLDDWKRADLPLVKPAE